MLFRFTRLGDHRWGLLFTRWLYLSNASYPGERKYFIRLGRWPGWARTFGSIRKEL